MAKVKLAPLACAVLLALLALLVLSAFVARLVLLVLSAPWGLLASRVTLVLRA